MQVYNVICRGGWNTIPRRGSGWGYMNIIWESMYNIFLYPKGCSPLGFLWSLGNRGRNGSDYWCQQPAKQYRKIVKLNAKQSQNDISWFILSIFYHRLPTCILFPMEKFEIFVWYFLKNIFSIILIFLNKLRKFLIGKIFPKIKMSWHYFMKK